MSADSKELSILITTKAELAGAQQLERSLEADIGKAKALGNLPEVERLSTQLTAVRGAMGRASEGSKELKKSMEEESEAAEFLHHNHRALHQTLDEIGNQAAPGAGRALGAMLMGPLGPAVALVSVVGLLKEKYDAWNESLLKAAENAATADFAGGIEAARKAVEAGESALAGYEQTIANIALHEQTIATALQAQLTLMNQIAAAREAARKAMEAAQGADIDRREAQHQLTPEQATVAHTAAAIKAVKDEYEARQQQENDALATLQQKHQEGVARQSALDQDAEAKRKKADDEEAHRARLETDFGGNNQEWQKKQEEFRKNQNVGTVADTEEALRKAQTQFDQTGPLTYGYDKHNRDVAQHEFDRAQDVQRNLDRGRNQYLAARDNPQIEKDKKAADEAATRGTTNAQDVSKIQDQITELTQKIAATRSAQDQELAARIATIMEQAVAKLSGSGHGAELSAGGNIADAVERGQRVGNDMGTFLIRLANQLGAHTDNLKVAADFVEKLNGDTEKFIAAVVRLSQQSFQATQSAQRQLDALAPLVEKALDNARNH